MIDPKNYNHKLYEIAKEGKSGLWSITKTLEEVESPIISYDSVKGTHFTELIRGILPIVTLYQDSVEVMTNEVREIESYKPMVSRCKGKTLMVGLGLGLLPSLVWDKIGKEVEQLDILEYNKDVIALVKTYISHPSIRIIPGDAWTFPSTCRETYDSILIDIWNGNAEAVTVGPIISTLYEPILKPNGMVRFWLQELQERLSNSRGPDSRTYQPCLICGGGWFMGHYNYYGGLCRECSDEYESYLPEKELRSTKDLEPSLKNLGYKLVTKPLVREVTENTYLRISKS